MPKSLCPTCQTRLHNGDTNPAFKCAFDKDGKFTQDNWNCATLEALGEISVKIYGNDQTIDIISSSTEYGMIVLSRYKRRGAVSQAILLDVGTEPVQILDIFTALRFLPDPS